MSAFLKSVMREQTTVDDRKERFDSEDGDLANILFELEVKTTGQKSKSYQFTASDFDWESDPFLPNLDITDKIEVLGDYYSDN